jgi:hypothetical protein
MIARVAIDPNVRVRGNQTYAGFEDIQGTVVAGSHVEVYEPESGLTGPAEVTDVDHERRLVYLAVDWGQLREQPTRGHLFNALAEVARRVQVVVQALLHRLTEPSRQRVR